jgi:tetratricopeptide (TPR) repeat protein
MKKYEIKAKECNYNDPGAGHPVIDGNVCWPNLCSVIEAENEIIMSVFNEETGKSAGLATKAEQIANPLLRKKTLSFGKDGDYIIEDDASFTLQESKGKTEIFVDAGDVTVNGKKIANRSKIKKGSIIASGEKIIERFDSIDELILKALSTQLFYSKSEEKKGVAAAIARIDRNGKMAVTYTAGQSIRVYSVNNLDVFKRLNTESDTELLGKKPAIAPVHEEFSLVEHPAIFICTQSYYEYLKSEPEEKIKLCLLRYKDVAPEKDIDKVLEEVMDRDGGFPQPEPVASTNPGTSRDIPKHPEFSFAVLISHKEKGGIDFSGLRQKCGEYLRKPNVKLAAKVAAATAAAGVCVLSLAALAGRYAGKAQKDVPVAEKTEDNTKKTPDNVEKVDAQKTLENVDTNKTKVEPEIPPTAPPVEVAEPKVPERIEVAAEKTGDNDGKFIKIDGQGMQNYEKASSQLKSVSDIIAQVSYRNAIEKITEIEKSIESAQEMLKGNVAKKEELESKISDIMQSYAPFKEYVEKLKASEKQETAAEANSFLASFLFSKGEYEMAWQHIEKLADEQRAGLGIINRIYVLEKQLATPQEVIRTPKGLTSEVIKQTDASIKDAAAKSDYEQISNVLRQMSAYFKVESGHALPLIKELPDYEVQLSALPSESLEAKELRWLVSKKRKMLLDACSKVIEQAHSVLQAEGAAGPDKRLYRQLGDLYMEAGKKDRADDNYRKSD